MSTMERKQWFLCEITELSHKMEHICLLPYNTVWLNLIAKKPKSHTHERNTHNHVHVIFSTITNYVNFNETLIRSMKWTNGKIKTHQYVFSAHVLQGAQSYNRAYDRIDSNQTPIELREREGEKESVPYTRIYYIWYFHKKVTTERNNNTDNKKKTKKRTANVALKPSYAQYTTIEWRRSAVLICFYFVFDFHFVFEIIVVSLVFMK